MRGAAERAVRPQHARRSDQRHQREAVADPVDAVGVPCRSATTARATSAATSSGPLSDTVGGRRLARPRASATASRPTTLTGNDLDYREAPPARRSCSGRRRQWETRLIFSGERARDGDYALSDLAALRANRSHVARDFEGHTDRDIFSTTVLARRAGSRVTLRPRPPASSAGRRTTSPTSTTGRCRWSPATTPKRTSQFTQEVRLASAPPRR